MPVEKKTPKRTTQSAQKKAQPPPPKISAVKRRQSVEKRAESVMSFADSDQHSSAKYSTRDSIMSSAETSSIGQSDSERRRQVRMKSDASGSFQKSVDSFEEEDEPVAEEDVESDFDQDFFDPDIDHVQQRDDDIINLNDELFTDKDRAAAVALGSKDLKLLQKKGGGGEKARPEEIGAAQRLNQGKFEFQQGSVVAAAAVLTKALELQPNSKECLVARARCYFELADYDSALVDTEAALAVDREYVQALYQKGEILYITGDFEHALVYYHRGYKLRPDYEIFRQGVQKAQNAIENSVGYDAGIKLNEKDCEALEKPDEAAKAEESPTTSRRGSAESSLISTEGSAISSHKTAASSKISKASSNIEKNKAKATKQLLGELAVDKNFLEKLLSDKELARTTHPTGYKAVIYAQDALSFLKKRQKFWLQEKPLYSRKKIHMKMPKLKKVEKVIDDECILTKWNKAAVLMKNLEDADHALLMKQYQLVIQKCMKLLTNLDLLTEDCIPTKPEIMGNTYSTLGCAYLELQKHEDALDCHMKDLEIAKEYKFEEALSRALDNIGRTYASAGQYEKALEIFEEKLPLCMHPVEKAWLNHEIGRCHIELGHYERGKEYGLTSLQYAEEAGDNGWKLNAFILIAQSSAYLADYQGAFKFFAVAAKLAKENKDVSAQKSIKFAMKKLKRQLDITGISYDSTPAPSDDSKHDSGMDSSMGAE